MRIESDLQDALHDGPQSAGSEMEVLRPRLIDELESASLEPPVRRAQTRGSTGPWWIAAAVVALGAMVAGGAFLALVVLAAVLLT